MDFGLVKKALRALGDRLDHHVLVATKSPHYRLEEQDGTVRFAFAGKSYVLPRNDVELLPIEYTSAESLAMWVASELEASIPFPPGVEEIEIGVDESLGKGAWVVRRLPSRP
jgi:6-pyruvoyltetrahydropterin/6-carboxytetrahydropterin synthase